METEPANAREMRDDDSNDEIETQATNLEGLSIQNQRLARIDEYEEAALSRTDPFAAVLGMGNAYFQRIFERLGAAVLEVIETGPQTVEQMRELAPEIRLMIKLRNAIEADLEIRSAEEEQPSTAFQRGRNAKRIVATAKRELLPKHWKGGTSY